MNIYKIILILCLIFPAAYLSNVEARQMAGVEFDQVARLDGIDKELKLNGLAIRYKIFFKIYVAALYVEQTSQDPDFLIQHSGARRMLMHFIYDEVLVEKLVSGWLEGFKDNTSEEDFKLLKSRIDHFNAMFETLHEGDVVLLDYLPGQGTRVTIKRCRKRLY